MVLAEIMDAEGRNGVAYTEHGATEVTSMLLHSLSGQRN